MHACISRPSPLPRGARRGVPEKSQARLPRPIDHPLHRESGSRGVAADHDAHAFHGRSAHFMRLVRAQTVCLHLRCRPLTVRPRPPHTPKVRMCMVDGDDRRYHTPHRHKHAPRCPFHQPGTKLLSEPSKKTFQNILLSHCGYFLPLFSSVPRSSFLVARTWTRAFRASAEGGGGFHAVAMWVRG